MILWVKTSIFQLRAAPLPREASECVPTMSRDLCWESSGWPRLDAGAVSPPREPSGLCAIYRMQGGARVRWWRHPAGHYGVVWFIFSLSSGWKSHFQAVSRLGLLFFPLGPHVARSGGATEASLNKGTSCVAAAYSSCSSPEAIQEWRSVSFSSRERQVHLWVGLASERLPWKHG